MLLYCWKGEVKLLNYFEVAIAVLVRRGALGNLLLGIRTAVTVWLRRRIVVYVLLGAGAKVIVLQGGELKLLNYWKGKLKVGRERKGQ